jgi:DNA-binding PadR family transcriptional regulator
MGRRAKRVYRITESGKRQFADLLGAEVSGGDEARSFGLRLAFARYLPPQARMRLLERRRAQLAERLFATRATAGRRGALDPYARSLVEHTADATEREISWLESLIDLERSSTGNHDQNPRAERAET